MMTSRRPVIGKLVTPGSRPPTRIPTELKVLSPTGLINRNMGGIGLGIVAALENIPADKKAGSARPDRMWSDPIPVVGDRGKNLDDSSTSTGCCNKPKKVVKHGGKKIGKNRKKGCIFSISTARFGDDETRVAQPVGFLNLCHLCNKRLDGKDIYMYRGEKAFCSPECRSRQIAMDERPEKYCSSQASSSGGAASRMITTGIFAI